MARAKRVKSNARVRADDSSRRDEAEPLGGWPPPSRRDKTLLAVSVVLLAVWLACLAWLAWQA